MSTSISVAVQKKQPDGTYGNMYLKPEWQSYGLFAWLANVRNNEHQIVPLSMPRGFPEDLKKKIKQQEEEEHSLGFGGYDSYNPPQDSLTRSIFGDACYEVHSISWFSIEELLAVDYDQIVEDRRNYDFHYHGSDPLPIGQGNKETLRDFIGKTFIKDLQSFKEAGADRILFCFD